MTHGDELRFLIDLEAIKALKYRYLRFLDTKDWEGFEGCFIPEVTADYGGLVFANRTELVDYMRENMGPGLISMHTVHHPEITIDGDTATGRWYLHDRVIVPDFHFNLEGTAFYEDEYVRLGDEWKVSKTGYQRVYETAFSTEDLPSLKAERKWVGTGAVIEQELSADQ